eukprot:1686747-Rhodomonas_salina.2
MAIMIDSYHDDEGPRSCASGLQTRLSLSFLVVFWLLIPTQESESAPVQTVPDTWLFVFDFAVRAPKLVPERDSTALRADRPVNNISRSPGP